jgi:hypothetical protein
MSSKLYDDFNLLNLIVFDKTRADSEPEPA